MLIVYIYVALACYNVGHLTLKLGSVDCLVDEAANVAVVDTDGNLVRHDKQGSRGQGPQTHGKKGSKGREKGKNRQNGGTASRQSSIGQVHMNPELDWRTLWNEGTDAVMDIPIGGVCEILYGAHSDDDDDEGDTPYEHVY